MQGGNDAYNARQVAKRDQLSAAELLMEFERNRAATVACPRTRPRHCRHTLAGTPTPDVVLREGSMYLRHASEVWSAYPELVPAVLHAPRITRDVDVAPRLAAFHAVAEARLGAGPESELPEIQAWRRAFARMGLKPTQYRCASESLLRRFRKERSLPRIHPLIDLCNAMSLAFAIPIAVFDVSKITESIEVRHATGAEVYVAFSGEEEHPEPGEVIFADEAGRAHARRWTNRQSRDSAVGEDTTAALIVAEAMHPSAAADTQTLAAAISRELEVAWSIKPTDRDPDERLASIRLLKQR